MLVGRKVVVHKRQAVHVKRGGISGGVNTVAAADTCGRHMVDRVVIFEALHQMRKRHFACAADDHINERMQRHDMLTVIRDFGAAKEYETFRNDPFDR